MTVTYRNKRTGKTVRRSKPSRLLDQSKRFERVQTTDQAQKGKNEETK
jgi:hypothetical protein